MRQQLTTLIIPCTLALKDEPFKMSFETALTQAIDDSLSTFGITAKQAIYQHLEIAYKINKEEIPIKIEAFINSFEETFGPSAKLLEIKIIENLHGKVKDFAYHPKQGEPLFKKYLINLQKYLQLDV